MQYRSSKGWKKLDTARQSSKGRAVLVARPKASGPLKVRAVTKSSKARKAGHSASRSVHVYPVKAPRIFAHRGLSSTWPENTLGAYRAALRTGADGVETDMQRTSDGQIVLVHDSTLARTTNVETVFPGRTGDPVGSFTLDELKQLDFGSWKGKRWRGTPVTTLVQLLDLLNGTKVRLIAEIKVPGAVAPPGLANQVVTTFDERGMIRAGHGDPVEIISFDRKVLRETRTLSANADIGYVSSAKMTNLAAWKWVTTLHLKHNKVDAALIKRARASKLGVVAWTVNEKPDAYRLADLGVNGITTNVAGVLRGALRR